MGKRTKSEYNSLQYPLRVVHFATELVLKNLEKKCAVPTLGKGLESRNNGTGLITHLH